MRAISASNQASSRWPTTRRASAPTAMITTTVPNTANAACAQGSSIQPSISGCAAARLADTGPTQGWLMSDSRASTNLKTIQTSQIGSRVSRPVKK